MIITAVVAIAAVLVGAVGIIILVEWAGYITDDAIFRAPNYQRDQEEYNQTLKAREDEKK